MYKKMLKIFLVFLVFFVFSNAKILQKDIENLMILHRLDIRVKSTKGWIRLFNNRVRLQRREYNFTGKEIIIIKKYLKEKYNMEKQINEKNIF